MNHFKVLILWLALACFVNSFLMFLVQPMVAKAILPAFGGSAAVWTGVMLFFQSALVLGYGLAHGMRRLTGWRLTLAYGGLTLLAVAGCRLNSLFLVEPGDAPTLSVTLALAGAVGLPFLLVSVTTPMIQVIFFRAVGREPYWLYGISNIASILALVLYPVLFEPSLELTGHMALWFWALVLTATSITAVTVMPPVFSAHQSEEVAEGGGEGNGEGTGPRWRFIWFFYPFLASVALLAFTTHVTIDVAPVPLLWVLPLGLYLLTFVLVFYPRPIICSRVVGPLCLVVCLIQSTPYFGWGQGPALWVLPVTLLCMFVLCWFCHGRLALARPHASGLTRFYFSLSVGGALGGVFSGLVAPAVFPDYFEFPLVIMLISLLALASVVFFRDAPWRPGKAPLIFRAVAALVFALTLALNFLWFFAGTGTVLMRERNFYGALRVMELETTRQMVSGRISHGVQVLPPGDPMKPTAYFHEETVLPLVINALPAERQRRMTVLGLGAGTVAVYNRSIDRMDFIEINPLVADMARTHFTFLGDAAGEVRLDVGDGRKVLESTPEAFLDMLMIDAFTGDSVPVHLLTQEAYQEYTSKLTDGGFLIYNISNRHLELSKLMVGLAESNGWSLELVKCRALAPYGVEAHYAVFTARSETMPDFSGNYRVVVARESWPEPVLWTDQYSNLLGVLKVRF